MNFEEYNSFEYGGVSLRPSSLSELRRLQSIGDELAEEIGFEDHEELFQEMGNNPEQVKDKIHSLEV